MSIKCGAGKLDRETEPNLKNEILLRVKPGYKFRNQCRGIGSYVEVPDELPIIVFEIDR